MPPAELNTQSYALRDLGLRDATDEQIFAAARSAAMLVVLITKDRDVSEPVLRQHEPALPFHG